MKKAEKLAQINEWLRIMDWALKKINRELPVHEEAINLKTEVIQEAYRWTKNLYSTEFDHVMCIHRLLPQKIWDRYDAWPDFDESREYVELKKRLHEFRKVVISRHRPSFFKKTHVAKMLCDN